MSYKTLLLCLTDADNAKRISEVGVLLARKFDAHLIGLHVMQSLDIYPGVTIPVSSQVQTAYQKEQIAEAEEVEEIFRKATEPEDFISEWRCVESRSLTAAERIIKHARCADLTIVQQPDSEHERADELTIQRELIEGAGSPVLVIPGYGEVNDIGKRILIGWSGTRESTRATHDALPFLQQADSVNIFWISKRKKPDPYLSDSAREMAAALHRNGANVDISQRVDTEVPIGDQILNEVADTGADLIVSGAYGHSRIYDFMIGATTPHLMRHMTAPVLFSC